MPNLPAQAGHFQGRKPVIVLVIGLAICSFSYYLLTAPPKDFPPPSFVKVAHGEPLGRIADDLVSRHIVSSKKMLDVFVVLSGGERKIVAGDYYFDKPVPVFVVASRLSSGNFNIAPVRITFAEGATDAEMAQSVSGAFPRISNDDFFNAAKDKQGYLFPDTYLFSPDATVSEITDALSQNFDAMINPLSADILKSGHSQNEIITMASIIEKEASGAADRNIISGILWKRISLGMPLEVDAAPDTYHDKGLPANPICNPGLLSIKAAVYPQASPYLFYLHDKSGMVHYAETFAEHKKNKLLYL